MKTNSTLLAFARPRVLWGLGISSLVALLATMIFTSFPPSSAWAAQVAPVVISDDCPTPPYATIRLSTATPGAIIFFKTSHTGFPTKPTHNGSTPTNGTAIYRYPYTVPYNAGNYDSILYTVALAYKPGFVDSVVSSDMCDNTGN